MPGPKGRGRVTPSQAGRKLPGVCREHVPPAKAKICSELHGNMQRSAETTDPVYSIRQQRITVNRQQICNTNYIHWRPHSSRNMVPLNPDRYATNQDALVKLIAFAGNMTISNRALQGAVVA